MTFYSQPTAYRWTKSDGEVVVIDPREVEVCFLAPPRTTPDPHIDADRPELVLDEKAHRSPFGPGPRRSA